MEKIESNGGEEKEDLNKQDSINEQEKEGDMATKKRSSTRSRVPARRTTTKRVIRRRGTASIIRRRRRS